MLHNFEDSLALSHSQADAPWWGTVYKKAFPGFECMMSVRQVGWAQRGGIDRVILLKSGKTITVDEKVRSKEYDDILLERWSDEKKQKPGWIQKDLACDFIAYAFIQSQRCFLFPFLQLRKCWIDNGRAWVRDYKEIRAENNGYTTVSVGVPINILTAALREAMEVKW